MLYCGVKMAYFVTNDLCVIYVAAVEEVLLKDTI